MSSHEDLESVDFTLPGEARVDSPVETNTVARAGKKGKRASAIATGKHGSRRSDARANCQPAPSGGMATERQLTTANENPQLFAAWMKLD